MQNNQPMVNFVQNSTNGELEKKGKGDRRKLGIVGKLTTKLKGRRSGYLLLAFAVLLLIVGAGTYYFTSRFIIEPIGVRVTNITSNSATVTWATDNPQKAVAIAVPGDGEMKRFMIGDVEGAVMGYDDRDYSQAELELAESNQAMASDGDISGNELKSEVEVEKYGSYKTHHVTFRGLDPESNYTIYIGDGNTFKLLSDEVSQQFTTLSTLEELTTPDPIYGKVLDRTDDKPTPEPLTDGVFYYYLENDSGERTSSFISAPLANNGSWYLDITSLRSPDGGDLLETYSEDEIFSFKRVGEVRSVDGALYRTEVPPYEDAPARDFILLEEYQIIDETPLQSLMSFISFESHAEWTVTCSDGRRFCASPSDEASFTAVHGGNAQAQWISEANDACNTNMADTCGGGGGGTPQEPGTGGTLPGAQCADGVCGPDEFRCWADPDAAGCEWRRCVGGGWTVADDKCQDPDSDAEDKDSGDLCALGKTFPWEGGCDGYGSLMCIDCNGTGVCGYDNSVCNNIPGDGEPADEGDNWTGSTCSTSGGPQGENTICCGKFGDTSTYGLISFNDCEALRDQGYNVLGCAHCENTTPAEQCSGSTYPTGTNGLCLASDIASKAEGGCYIECKLDCGDGQSTSCDVGKICDCDQASQDPDSDDPLNTGVTVVNGPCFGWCSADTMECVGYSAGSPPTAGQCKYIDGTPCSTPSSCVSGKCESRGSAPICVAATQGTPQSLPGLNEPCDNGQCGGGYTCVGRSWESGIQKFVGGTCKIPDGLSCGSDDNSCASGWCDVNGDCGGSGQGDPLVINGDCPNSEGQQRQDGGGVLWCMGGKWVRLIGLDERCTGGSSCRCQDVGKGLWDGAPIEVPEGQVCRDTLGTHLTEGRPIVSPGQTCNDDACWCEGGVKTTSGMGGSTTSIDSWEIHEGQVCPAQTFATCSDSTVGEFCDASGKKTCQQYIHLDPDPNYCRCPNGGFGLSQLSPECEEDLNDQEYKEYCNSSIRFSCETEGTYSFGLQSGDSNLSKLPDLVTAAKAQSEIILSPSDGVYAISTSGRYCTDVIGVGYCFELESGREFNLFIDNNKNNILDEGDIRLEDGGISLRLEEAYSIKYMDIITGLNLIHLDHISDDYATAFEFIAHLNSNYSEGFFSLAGFDSGSWSIVGMREDGSLYGSDDFQLIPGRGYLLKSNHDYLISLRGMRILDPVPISLSPGWNLVGLAGSDTSYTAESLIDSLNANTFVVDNVSSWSSDKGRYDGLQKELDENDVAQVYGFDYPILVNNGYFVRVLQGDGLWIPE